MGRKKDYEFDWRNMTTSQKLAVYEGYRKTANRRLRRLRENEISAPQGTMDYLQRTKHRTFTKVSGKSVTELNGAIMAVESFLRSEGSTLSGIKNIAARVRKGIEKYNERWNEYSGSQITIDVNDRDLINFLHSRLYHQLRSKIGSKEAIEDFSAFTKTATVDEVMQEYEKFLNNKISYRDVKKKFG